MTKKDPIENWKTLSLKQRKKSASFVINLNKNQKKAIADNIEDVHERVFERTDCLKCANCCTSIPPQISKLDVKRISKYLGLSEKQFLAEYTSVDSDGDLVFNQSPCRFLEKDNTCRIYEFRPKACRAFPHTDNDQFLNHLNLHKQNVQYCPAVYAILEEIQKRIKS
ncbi:MAG: YkgJ family cysteine cluster protein [Flavobacteriales bacterium]|nr:YkgJ family cysteine cluster protein [Flavobacteriales bacterium]